MKRITQLFVIVMLGVATSARAGTKEELIRLQADVLALKNQISMLEKTFAERTDSIRSLVVQLNDQVGKSTITLGKISNTLEMQSVGDTSMQQAVLQEIKGLAIKMDDANTRISALAQQIAEMKVQAKPLPQRTFQAAAEATDAAALSADKIYGEAYNDLVKGNFELAIEGFNAFLKTFPTNDKADDAQYNIGEAYYGSNKFPEALAAFSKVITDYTSGGKTASAFYKRGKTELALQQRDAAIADFRMVIDKYPATPEASLAKAEMLKLGIDTSKPPKPVIKKIGV